MGANVVMALTAVAASLYALRQYQFSVKAHSASEIIDFYKTYSSLMQRDEIPEDDEHYERKVGQRALDHLYFLETYCAVYFAIASYKNDYATDLKISLISGMEMIENNDEEYLISGEKVTFRRELERNKRFFSNIAKMREMYEREKARTTQPQIRPQ
jgi:hypothetical protein